MRRENCKHYRGCQYETCKAGVAYASVSSRPGTFHLRSIPCVPEYTDGLSKCDKFELFTPEEIAEQERQTELRIARIGKARQAIVAHAGPHNKVVGAQGKIDCPNCGGEGSLAYSRAGYNGHIHARCSTENCCAWKE